MGHLMGKEYALDHLVEVAKSIVLAIHKAPQVTGKTKIEAEIVWGEDLEPILDVMGRWPRSCGMCSGIMRPSRIVMTRVNHR